MSLSPKILIVDDDETFRAVTSALLKDERYDITAAESAQEAEMLIRENAYHLILTDLVMTGKDGLALLQYAKQWLPDTPVVLVTGFASVDSAVQAMKAGAEDYLTKPCSSDELLLKIKRTLDKAREHQELTRLREEISDKYTFENIIGKSPAMQAVFSLIRQVAETDASVLLCGETGTGKELVAKAIHYNSLRNKQQFISVNCAALSETLLESELFGHERGAFTGAVKQKLGRFELADGGTLFLDEIGDISHAMQAKLLRVLQEKEFERVGGTHTIKTDIRLISATNKDLKREISEGNFREDLFYRLNVMPIMLTPLRLRREDIPILVQHFITRYGAKMSKKVTGISRSAAEVLLNYAWPGNVRELENVIERAVILCNDAEIDSGHLLYLQQQREGQLLSDALKDHITEAQMNRLYARLVLDAVNGNKKEACRILDINFRTLQNRLADT
jgi:DNA-binding NtrC family response regulator